jgi:hypothetical protein
LHLSINDSAGGGGVAFSSNSQVLYVSSMNYIYQFDLTSVNIAGTQTTVAVFDGFSDPNPPFYTNFLFPSLAPDGKIYVNTGNGSHYLHIIDSPNTLGINCNVIQHGLTLSTYNAFTIPTHANYFLGSVTGSICDSLTGINESEPFNFNFSVYPNPVQNNQVSFTYLLPQNETGLLELFDIVGHKTASYVLPQWSTFQKIALPQLSKGIYACKLKSGEYEVVKKIVVQ